MRDPIVVLKFGSSVLESPDALPTAVLEIYREIRRGWRVVAVVSAFGSTTDDLLAEARERFGPLDDASLARWLETGETQSAASLGLALHQAGVPASILDAGQIGLRTSEEILDAEPLEFDVVRLGHELLDVPVVVIPGFSGRRADGAVTLLGRGGSDLTALFLARGMRAVECRLLKDVCGLLRVREDGSLDHQTRYSTATYEECLRVGGPLIQPKAVEFAAQHRLKFTVTRCGIAGGTIAGSTANTFEEVDPAPRPTTVVLGGLGTVGLGVWRWLQTFPTEFRVVGILVADPHKKRPADILPALITSSVQAAHDTKPDLVIETIGGTGAAAELVAGARRRACAVISANKQLLALDPELGRAVGQDPSGLRAAASVGGSVPALETVARLADRETIHSIKGILNGTCNFILHRVNEGLSYGQALAEAQDKGLAEADPHLDVSGLDLVYKLSLLAGLAFGESVPVDQILCEGLEALTPERLAAATESDAELKLVAEARRTPAGIRAQVQLAILPTWHTLHGCPREENRLVVETENHRRVVVDGRGAGRWPTTVAVVADVLESRRALQAQTLERRKRRQKAS